MVRFTYFDFLSRILRRFHAFFDVTIKHIQTNITCYLTVLIIQNKDTSRGREFMFSNKPMFCVFVCSMV